MRQIDVLLCYRQPGAQTAKLMKRYLQEHRFPGSVWYSQEEPYGNYKTDIPALVKEAECAVLLIDPAFTRGFLDASGKEECITSLEVTEIARRKMEDPSFRLITIYLNRTGGMTADESDCLHTLFVRQGLEDPAAAVRLFSQSNIVPFSTATGDEDDLFFDVSNVLLSNDYYRRNASQGNFRFGTLSTQADLVVWDSGRNLQPEDISFVLDPDQPLLYRKIERAHEKLEYEVQNNTMVSLTGIDVSLSDNEERKKISVRFQKISYQLFYKTLMLWNQLEMDREIASYDAHSGPYRIPNAVGLAFMVITADSRMIFTRRSRQRKVRSGEYDVSIVEGLKISGTDPEGNAYGTDDESYLRSEIRRAFREEVCSDDRGLTMTVNGMTLDRQYGQWNVIGVLHTALSSEEIRRIHPLREDTYEDQEVLFIPFRDENGYLTLSQLGPFLRRCRREGFWSMGMTVAAAALLAAGFTADDISALSGQI